MELEAIISFVLLGCALTSFFLEKVPVDVTALILLAVVFLISRSQVYLCFVIQLAWQEESKLMHMRHLGFCINFKSAIVEHNMDPT